MKKLLLLTLVAISAAACSTLGPNSYVTYDYNESTARNLEPEHIMLTTPVIADLDVSGKRITHIEKEAFADIVVDGYAIQPENMEGYKKIALSRAAKAYDADVLLGSMIDVQTIEGRLVITVTGFPAKYVNFRKATLHDAELMREASIFRNNKGDIVVASPEEEERVHLFGNK